MRHGLINLVVLAAVGTGLVTTACASSATARPGRPVALHGFVMGDNMTVDRHGNVYAAAATQSLVKFSPSGELLASWNGWVTDAVHPDTVGSIALGPGGTVYATDLTANRVVVLSSSLRLLAQWGSTGLAPGQFMEPDGLAVDAHGNVYVSDLLGGRVQKLSPHGQPLPFQTRPFEFSAPLAVAVDRQGFVYVTDTGHRRIVKLSQHGTPLGAWPGGLLGSLSAPTSVSLDGKGNLYVADPVRKRLVKFSARGQLLASWKGTSRSAYLPLVVTAGKNGRTYAIECANVSKTKTQRLISCRIVQLAGGGKMPVRWLSPMSAPIPAPPSSVNTIPYKPLPRKPLPLAGQPAAPPPVQMRKIDVGGYSITLRCAGQGSPAVILDSGADSTGGVWFPVQTRVGFFTQVCAFDRPGIGLSDPRPSSVPLTSGQVVREVHTLLANAGIPGPYVLVGHSIGGMDMRLYAYTYPSQVVGMVLAEGQPEDYCAYPGGCPPSPEGWDMSDSAAQLFAATHYVVKGSLGNLPLIVITRGTVPNYAWFDLQNTLATASSNSIHVRALYSTHLVNTQQPDLVAEAIREVVTAARSSSHRLPPCGQNLEHYGGLCLSSPGQ